MHHVTRNPIILLYLPFYNQHITKVTFLKCIKIHLRIVVSGGTTTVPPPPPPPPLIIALLPVLLLFLLPLVLMVLVGMVAWWVVIFLCSIRSLCPLASLALSILWALISSIDGDFFTSQQLWWNRLWAINIQRKSKKIIENKY